jgi:dynein heavy chain
MLSPCRLENGLNKLHKTQGEVDVLVENARAMALDVEQKVASANVFAEQVGGLCWHRSALLN